MLRHLLPFLLLTASVLPFLARRFGGKLRGELCLVPAAVSQQPTALWSARYGLCPLHRSCGVYCAIV